jgi:hypothetical protein
VLAREQDRPPEEKETVVLERKAVVLQRRKTRSLSPSSREKSGRVLRLDEYFAFAPLRMKEIFAICPPEEK